MGPYTITADTVTLTSCDSSELVIRNHTDTVPGFLFNAGSGRTIFKRGLQHLANGSFLIGADTLNAWVQGGNRFGTTGILGTLDNNPLDFYTNGSQRVRLGASGHLLVGSTVDNGTNTFQLYGSMYNSGFYTNSTDLLGGSNPSGAIRLRWGTGDGGYIGFYNQANTNLRGKLCSEADSRNFQVLDQVGVSLTAPNIVLGQEFGLGAKINLINTSSSNSWTQPSLYIGRTGADTVFFDVAVYGSGDMAVGRVFGGDDGNTFQVHGSADVAGPLGIGTASPTAQLHTTGAVRFAGLTQDSTQIRVLVSDANGNLYYRSVSSLAAENLIRSSLTIDGPVKAKKLFLSPDGWADYVFDSAYRLPRLADVESYIHREHHLPGIPAAAAIQKDSLDVGAGQAALLKKIEELTLYTIDQNKKLDDQSQKLANQDRQISALRAELEDLKTLIKQQAR